MELAKSRVRGSVFATTGEERLALLFAVFPALAFTIWWQFANYSLPVADAAGYLYTAQKIGQKFDLDGFVTGLLALYFDRGWRPIIYPSLVVPFHWIDTTDIRAIVAGTGIFFTALLSFWTYACFRTVLTPLRAALATVCCTIGPYYIVFSLNFFSELSLLAFSAGAVNHLIRSDLFRRRGHVLAFSVLFALTACTRPTEAPLVFAVPLFAAIWLGYRAKTVSRQDVLIAATIAAASAIVLLSQLFPMFAIRQLPDTVVLGLLLAMLAGGVALSALWPPRPLVEAALLSALAIVFWWLPFMRELFGWILASTVEGIGALWPKYHDPASAFHAVWESTGGVQFVVLTAIAAILLYDRFAAGRPILPASGERWLLIAAFPLALLPIVLTALAVGVADDPRRLLSAVMLVQITLLSLALGPSQRRTNLFVALVAATCLAQSIIVLAFATDYFPSLRARLDGTLFYNYVPGPFALAPPYSIAPGPDQSVFAFLQRHIPPQTGVILIDGDGIPEKIGTTIASGSGAPYTTFALGLLVDRRRPSSFWARAAIWPGPYDRFLDDSYTLGTRYFALADMTPRLRSSLDLAWELRDALSRAYRQQQLLSKFDLEEVDRLEVPGRADVVLLKLTPRARDRIWKVTALE